ncbi:MAG: hypothetical protein ACKVX7_05945 [Planctomycetota bacterium]
MATLPVGCTSAVTRTTGLAPIYERAVDLPNGESSWILRPLVSWEHRRDHRELSALWPLISHRRTAESARRWLIPIWFDKLRVKPEGGFDHDGVLLPIFYGNDSAEGSYFAIAPLGGVIKGLLGQDSITFALFPLYARLVDRERISTHWLFPIWNHVTAPTQSGWRIFPFYGRYRTTTHSGDPKHDRSFWLWPFFLSQHNFLDTSNPQQIWWCWPFYGRITSPRQRSDSFLYPLLTISRARNTPAYGVSSLFLFHLTRSEEVSQTDLWPLFGVKRTPTLYRQFCLFPIQRYQRTQVGDYTHESSWFLPFYWRHSSALRTTPERVDAIHRYWPFASHRQHADGSSETYIPDLLPFQDPWHFERFYASLWRFYQRVDRGPDAGSSWQFLWGLVAGENNPQGGRFSVLGGLFETRSGTTSGPRLRLLYLPFN